VVIGGLGNVWEFAHIALWLTEIEATGTGKTVRFTFAWVETQPALETVRVKFLLPGLDQERVCGPCVVGLPLVQPSQFQVKTCGPVPRVPVKVIVAGVWLLAQTPTPLAGTAVKAAIGIGFTETVCVAETGTQPGRA
jgi:hypothetical protein